MAGLGEPRRASRDDYLEIVAGLAEFWDGRDVLALHHPMFVEELGELALVIEDDAAIVAYLFGFVAGTTGYAHLAATRPDHRRRGLARRLYAEFAALARRRDAVRLKAITTPSNEVSRAFHVALGFTADEVADYAGRGRSRLVFRRSLDPPPSPS